MKPTELARQLGVSHTTVIRWCDGTRIPRSEMMDRIRAETGGAVQPNDFFKRAAVIVTEHASQQ
jgi:DNA-binding transcriptional regulator YdaS (Cro superfamily)